MSDQVQTTYPLSQERGQIGSLSRPLAPSDADAVSIALLGAGTAPGHAFKFDANGNAVKLTDLADSLNAEGILSFQIGQINQDVAGGTQHQQGIVYAEGDRAKYYRAGYMYCIAGGTVARGAEVGFDPATSNWKAQAGTKFVAAHAAVAGGVLEVIARMSA